MADKYWVGDTDTDWNDTDNWAATSGGTGGDGIPGSGDDVIFDDQYTTQNCTCDVAIDILSIDVQSTYDGILDFADSAYAHAIGGDAIFDGSSIVDCGDSTLTIAGNFDNKDQGTWTWGTSTIVMTGTSKTIISDFTKDVYNLTIDGTITISSATSQRFDCRGAFIINAGKTLTCDKDFGEGINVSAQIDGTLSISSGIVALIKVGVVSGTGVVTGAGTYRTNFSTITNAGTWSVANTSMFGSATLNAGTYGGTWTCDSNSSTRIFTFGGNVIFTGDVTFDADSTAYEVRLNTNDVSVEFQGDLDINETGGTLTWTKAATGDIDFSGTTEYTDTTAATQDIGNIVIPSTNTSFTLASDMACSDFTVESGGSESVDFADSAFDVTIGGAMTLDGGGTVDLGDAVVAVEGNFDNKDQTTFTKGTSTVNLTESTADIITSSTKGLYNLTITGSNKTLDATTTNYLTIENLLKLDGGSLILEDDVLIESTGDFQSSGTLTGSGTITVPEGATITSFGTNSGPNWIFQGTHDQDIAADTINGGTVLFESTNAGASELFSFAAGATVLNADVTFDADTAQDYTVLSPLGGISFGGDLTFSETGGGSLAYISIGQTNLIGDTTWTNNISNGSYNFDDIAVTSASTQVTLASDLDCVDLICDGSGDFDCADKTITISGDFDNKDQAWTKGTSTIIMTGASKTIIGHSGRDVHNLTIDGTIELSGVTATRFDVAATLEITEGSVFTLSDTCQINEDAAGLNNLGTIDGTGALWIEEDAPIIALGVISCNTLELRRAHNADIPAGQYDSNTVIFIGYNDTFKFAAGEYTFKGDVVIDADTANPYAFDLATNDPDIVFEGDVTISETGGDTFTWTKGTGDITFGGTTEYSDTTAAIQIIGDVIVDGTSLKLLTEMEADSFTGTSGALDTNGQTLDLAGNMDWASGFTITDPVGSTFEVGGNFTADGQDISGASEEWFLNVTGTAVASGTGDVAYSNADGGTEITASDGPWTDSGNNSNWDFGVAGGGGSFLALIGVGS